MQYNSKPVYMMDNRILVREGWKYLKYELQVPIYVTEVERGWQTSLLNMSNIYFTGRELDGSKIYIL